MSNGPAFFAKRTFYLSVAGSVVGGLIIGFYWDIIAYPITHRVPIHFYVVDGKMGKSVDATTVRAFHMRIREEPATTPPPPEGHVFAFRYDENSKDPYKCCYG